jgi:zinc protease
MKFVYPVIAAACFFSMPTFAAKKPKANFQIQLDQYAIQLVSYPFPSGLNVIFQEEHSQPIIAVTSVIDHGSEADPIGQEGIAHVVEHLAFRAKHGDLPKTMDLIKQLGGGFNASTSVDWTNYMTIAPRDAMEALLAIEAKRLKDGVANVTESDVRLEVEIARNELRMRYENAAIGTAWDKLGNLLFPEGHPYTRSTIGSHDSLNNIDLKAVQDFVKTNYVPEDTTMVVVGDFKLDEAFGILLKAFEQDLDLLMSPEDAAKYSAITDFDEQRTFLDEWVAGLGDYIRANAGQGAKQRIDCSKRATPPAPVSQEPIRVKGMVDYTTVVTAWSVPGAYCGDDMVASSAANQLTNYIYQTITPSWEWGSQDQTLEGLGCFYSGDEYFGTVICYVEPSDLYDGEKLAEKVGDSLYLQWDREAYTKIEYYRAFVDWAFGNSKAAGMSSLLLSVDEVAALYGRATATAMDAHFSGDVRYFSRAMQEISSVQLPQIQQFGQDWLTRDRMVTVIVEPMDAEERARREAAARAGEEGDTDYHATSRDDKLKTLFSLSEMAPERVASQTIVPDRTAMRELTLDNGLNVVIFPYGEAPIVRASLVIGGRSYGSPKGTNGLDWFADQLHDRGTKMSGVENIMAVAGSYGIYGRGSSSVLEVAGSSGNLGALLNKMRAETGQIDWQMADKAELLRDKIKGVKSRTKNKAENWSARLHDVHLYPGHRFAGWADIPYYEKMKEWDGSDVQDWVKRRYQPANSTLVIVGKMNDVDQAEKTVRDFFEGWQVDSGVEVGPLPKAEPPVTRPDRMVYLYDKPIATQVDITASCQLENWNTETYMDGKILGSVLSERAWRRLRENAGVTYGAYAYTESHPGGAAALHIAGLFQNDATEFALNTLLDIIAQGAEGDIDDELLANSKWETARKMVLGQQSGQQMSSMIVSAIESGRGLDYLDALPQYVSEVTKEDLVRVIAPCAGHEVVSIVGPLEYTEPALKNLKLPYQVVDWDSEYRSMLSEGELKKYIKALEREAKSKAKEEAKKAAAG